MERAEYERMHRLEDRMWWYRAAHANLIAAWRRQRPGSGMVLDAGCGTGGFLRRLAAAAPETNRVGIDFDAEACRLARAKSLSPVAVGTVNALPFADGSLAAIFSVDVLCHRNVEPVKALAEAYRCLGPGGLLVVNLPAYAWLLSAHDERVHNVRRFTRGQARALLAAAGFRVARAGYWNALLFPLMLLRRTVLKPRAAESDVIDYAPAVDRLFGWATAVERVLLGAGLAFPFGGSVLAVAVKDA